MRVEPGGGHPPRLPDRRRAARHRHRLQVPDPLEAGQVGHQDLAAPDRAVGAPAEPVEGDADHRTGLAVVGQAGGDVGVVVLDAGQLDGAAALSSRSRAYLVDRYSGCRSWATTSGRTSNSRPKCSIPLGEGPPGLVVLQVADVVGHEGVVALGPGRRCSSARRPVASTGPGEVPRQGDGAGGVAPGPAQHELPAPERPGHRVVGPDVDGPVVDQEDVGDAAAGARGRRRRRRRSARRRGCRW